MTFHLGGEDLTTQVRTGGWSAGAGAGARRLWLGGGRSAHRAAARPIRSAAAQRLCSGATPLRGPVHTRSTPALVWPPPCPPLAHRHHHHHQENRLTQERIDAELGTHLLGRAVFYGQSDIAALLEVGVRAWGRAAPPGATPQLPGGPMRCARVCAAHPLPAPTPPLTRAHRPATAGSRLS